MSVPPSPQSPPEWPRTRVTTDEPPSGQGGSHSRTRVSSSPPGNVGELSTPTCAVVPTPAWLTQICLFWKRAPRLALRFLSGFKVQTLQYVNGNLRRKCRANPFQLSVLLLLPPNLASGNKQEGNKTPGFDELQSVQQTVKKSGNILRTRKQHHAP